MYNLFVRAFETGRKESYCFPSLFPSECKLTIYLSTLYMYVYCAFPAIATSPKYLPNCLKKVPFDSVIYDVSCYTVTVSVSRST